MSKYDQLKKQSVASFAATEKNVGNRDIIADEVHRVSQIAYHAGDMISDLDKQFAQVTKLNATDVTFLFLATILQCTRQYVLSNEKLRLTNTQGDKLISKIVPKRWEDILLASVPYDAFFLEPDFKSEVGSIGVSGKTHRYRTLGHDPLLGWIFGTMNILSDSLTKTDLSTYKVSIPYVTGVFPGSVAGAFQCATEQASADKLNLPAAVVRQALHFGSDYFTKQGLPIPIIATLNNDLAKDMLSKWHIDMWSITRGATLSILINQVIACIHRLFYNEHIDGDESLYEIRTRKILSYSNVIASGSNVIYVALLKNLTKLDVGGILVTLCRLITDYRFIQKIKLEFMQNQWDELILGTDFNF